MSDLISRQAALRTFGLSEKSRKYGGDHSGYQTIMLYEVQDALEALPSEPRWIPVSERLPEEGKKVLITIASDSYDGEWNIQTTLIVSMARREDRYNRVFWHDYNMNIMWNDKAVTAWMPLPKPYEEESDGTQV